MQKFVFYYSGHSDERGLHLRDGLLAKEELHQRLASIPAKTKLVVLDSYYVPGAETTGVLGGYYDAMNESVIVTFFRDTLIPTAGFLARPFVPDEIATLLQQ